MNRFVRLVACLCLILAGVEVPVAGQNVKNLVPQPVEAKSLAGAFQLTAKTKIVVPAGNKDIREVADLFAAQLASLTGQKLEVVAGKTTQAIAFKLNNQASSRLANEGYSLTVTTQGITISANKPAGLFYGAQTLLQLIPPAKAKGSVAIACANVSDYPRFKWRGLMLDVSRHFFSKDEVKRFIDQMVKYKYNVFHWHLTDDNGWRVEIKSFPKLTSVGAWSVSRTGRYGSFEPEQSGEAATYGGFYTQDDIREIVKYAADRFVTIVPEVDVPAHSCAAIAAYPEMSCAGKQVKVSAGTNNGIGENVLCVGNENNFKMLDVIFGELASLFPGEYIHIGGDEANREFWKNCPKCQQRMKDENLKDLAQLQSYFTQRIGKILASKGKKLIGWDEILEGGIAPDATVMSWRGLDGAIAAAKAGHHAVMSPTSFCYLDYLQGEKNIERNSFGFLRAKRIYEFEPVPQGVDSSYILGGQGNVWCEFIPNFRRVEYMTWPRALVLSEILWSPKKNRSWDEFVPRMEAQFPRFDQAEVNYATSIYDPEIAMVKSADGDSRIVFTPEIKGLDIYYTFDCTFPDKFSAKYDGQPIKTPKGSSEIWAITYRDGKPVGRLLVITFDELKRR
ncbi:MAG: family 20 glycosylhydrolase [Bacteroidota bacterium]|nr:family 20 glycosylhydrolase [Bacteroidota bacterium]MDP4268555.1 family 20 glycosylhydrolase [Bacteroidota bacterium]